MSGRITTKRWCTALAPPLQINENHDYGHDGTTVPVATGNRETDRARAFFTHASSFLSVSLLRIPELRSLLCRMIQGPFRAMLPRPVFYRTVAVRKHFATSIHPDGLLLFPQGRPPVHTPERFHIPEVTPAIQSVAPLPRATAASALRAWRRPDAVRPTRSFIEDELRPAFSRRSVRLHKCMRSLHEHY